MKPQSNKELRLAIEEQTNFEQLLLEISSRFISLPVDSIDDAIEDAQRRICETLNLDLSALWQWSGKDSNILTITHLHSPPEGPERPVDIDASKTFPWIFKKVLSGETLAFSTEQLPEEASLDKENRRLYGVKSSVVVPIQAGGKPIIGTVSFDTLHEERSWNEQDIKRIKLVTEVFTNALARKQSEQKIIESETRLNLAADSAKAGLWELNISTGLFWATERASTIFSYPPGEVISMKRFEQSVFPDDLDHVRKNIDRSLERREPLSVAYRIHSGDGEMRWIHSSGRPYFKSDGKPDRLLGVSVDITESKLMEEALRNNKKDLENLAGRLISVQEEELRRLSRELHDDLTQSLAVLAIEAGKLELQMNKMEQPQVNPAQKISEIKEQLIKVSEDVHRISRQLHPRILDDLGLIRAIESECAAFGQRENIEITFTKDAVPEMFPEGVPLCLYRIVQEGLNNITNHSGAKKCEILLKEEDESICLTVKDEGVGFDPDEVRNKPGLGLASMRERVQLVKGNLTIETKSGKGTTIQVSMPLKGEEGDDTTARTSC
jgi:PAS domain S-box-containing protein